MCGPKKLYKCVSNTRDTREIRIFSTPERKDVEARRDADAGGGVIAMRKQCAHAVQASRRAVMSTRATVVRTEYASIYIYIYIYGIIYIST